MKLSIIVPVLDEAPRVRAALDALQPLRAAGHEVIVVDGGSADGTSTWPHRSPIAPSRHRADVRCR